MGMAFVCQLELNVPRVIQLWPAYLCTRCLSAVETAAIVTQY